MFKKWRKLEEDVRFCVNQVLSLADMYGKMNNFISSYKEKEYLERGKFVHCEVCGCLIERGNCIKGEAEIRERLTDSALSLMAMRPEMEDYIYYPYYCKIHAPKEEEKE